MLVIYDTRSENCPDNLNYFDGILFVFFFFWFLHCKTQSPSLVSLIKAFTRGAETQHILFFFFLLFGNVESSPGPTEHWTTVESKQCFIKVSKNVFDVVFKLKLKDPCASVEAIGWAAAHLMTFKLNPITFKALKRQWQQQLVVWFPFN